MCLNVSQAAPLIEQWNFGFKAPLLQQQSILNGLKTRQEMYWYFNLKKSCNFVQTKIRCRWITWHSQALLCVVYRQRLGTEITGERIRLESPNSFLEETETEKLQLILGDIVMTVKSYCVKLKGLCFYVVLITARWGCNLHMRKLRHRAVTLSKSQHFCLLGRNDRCSRVDLLVCFLFLHTGVG